MNDHLHSDEENEDPIEELKGFVLNDDPEFKNRVNRSLNRHLLLGDSLEFSLNIFQKTIWEYLKTMVETLPLNPNKKAEK